MFFFFFVCLFVCVCVFSSCFAAHFVISVFVSLTNSTASAGGEKESIMVVRLRRHNGVRCGTYFELGAMPKLAQKYGSRREFDKGRQNYFGEGLFCNISTLFRHLKCRFSRVGSLVSLLGPVGHKVCASRNL